MNLGIFSYFGYEHPLAQRLHLIRQAQFTHTAIWWGAVEEMVASGRQDSIPAMVRDDGLVLENMHVPYDGCNDLWSESADVRGRFVERHLRWLDDCARHDIRCMVLHVTHRRDAPDPTPQGAEAFGQVAQAAATAGVTLAVENTRRNDSIHYLLERIDSPWVKLCYDSSHDWLWGSPRTGVLSRWGHRLAQTHLSDCDAESDRHLLPGDGAVDWRQVAQAFPRATYDGCLMLEVLPNDLTKFDSPVAFLALARERLLWVRQVIEDGGSQPGDGPS